VQTGNSGFDEIAGRYNDEIIENLGIFGKFRRSMLFYKAQYLRYLLPNEPKGILDYGCSIGMNVPYLREYFPNSELYGCDISKESIKTAREKILNCRFDTIETAENLKMYRSKIDCVFISTVLHHIPYCEHEKWITGLFEILDKGGYMIIFEHNMKNPFTGKIVRRTPMDRNAVMLNCGYCKKMVKTIFGEKSIVKHGYTYFFPWRNKVFTGIEHRLSRLPLGAQYYVLAKKC
jgi:ubiquinone/menaquinone biosynthesis C-methylase UbiE